MHANGFSKWFATGWETLFKAGCLCAAKMRPRFLSALGLAGLLFLVVLNAYAERLPIKTYTTADGLVRDAINCIVRDSRGFLWFGTPEGLSRFDGYSFTNYTTADGLPHRNVRDVLETRGGAYWIATGGGLCRFNPMAGVNPQSAIRNPQTSAPLFTVYHPSEDKSARTILTLCEDHTGTIWCGTGNGVYRLKQAGNQVNFQFVDMGMPSQTADDRIVEDILEDRRGSLWVATHSGLYRRRPDGEVEHYTKQHGLPWKRVQALMEDREGRFWAATTAGLCLLVSAPDRNRSVVARAYTSDDGLSGNWVNALFQSSDGHIWTGSRGLTELILTAGNDDPKFRTYSTANGLSVGRIEALAEDRDGNLWIGTTSGGAMKLARNGFTTYGPADGLGEGGAVSIFEDQAGELCAITNDGRGRIFIALFDGKRFRAIRPNFPEHFTMSIWGWNQYILHDRQGEWWVPTGQGLCRFRKVNRVEELAHTGPKAVYTTRDGLITDEVFRIFEDSRGDIWINTTSLSKSGVTRWDRVTETFHTFSEADGLPAIWANAFCEDASGNVWIGYAGGLVRYRAGRFRVFTMANGLPVNSIRGLYLDHAGRLWMATDAGGVCRLDDPNADRPVFVMYTTANGLAGNQTYCITEDLWGHIYIGTGHGVDRLNPETGQIKHYTVADGLPTGDQGIAFRDRHGALWFSATSFRLSRLVPEANPPPPPPPIWIKGIAIAGESYRVSELGETDVSKITLEPNQNQLQIDFVALGFGLGESLRYQYKLEGADLDWNAPTDQRSVNYARLSPGSYRFLVRAVTSEGTTSQSPASVSFTILPPIWQRWWFVTLAALALPALVYAAYRYRVARLVELERVRTRIATDLHDDIGASLSRIAILSEVCKRQVDGAGREAVTLLSEIADSARTLVASMRDIVWAINPRHDDLLGVVSRVRQFASGLLEPRNIRWDLRTAEGIEKIKLDPDERRHLLLFFKEAVTNAARHAECRSLSISLIAERQRLVAEVRDDGCGFEGPVPDAAKAAGGHGLRNMEERATQLRAQLTIESGQGQGTSLRLAIPLRRW